MSFDMDGHGNQPTTVKLLCDHGGCHLKLTTTMKWNESLDDAQKRLWRSTSGWTRSGNKHSCPRHSR